MSAEDEYVRISKAEWKIYQGALANVTECLEKLEKEVADLKASQASTQQDVADLKPKTVSLLRHKPSLIKF